MGNGVPTPDCGLDEYVGKPKISICPCIDCALHVWLLCNIEGPYGFREMASRERRKEETKAIKSIRGKTKTFVPTY